MRGDLAHTPIEGCFPAGVWACDFEFNGGDGERPNPVCMVARDLITGNTFRLWRDELRCFDYAPFPTGPDALFVAFYASAELGCFISLGWPAPTNILDLYVEQRWRTNGLEQGGRALLAVLQRYGIAAMADTEKSDMRRLVLSRTSWSNTEQESILDYCAADVNALGPLLSAMTPHIDLPRALLRGRHMMAVARMEWNGVPLDTETLTCLKNYWPQIKLALISEVDAAFDVFDGSTFKGERFERYLELRHIPWPRHASGRRMLDQDTFKERARAYPQLEPLRQLRKTLDELRLNSLTVGHDGRNRTLISPFSSITGRNQPSNSKFIFGPSRWVRGLIRPEPGHGLAYIDYSSHEIGIAAGLSGDRALMEAYQSGDPYLSFAISAGLAPHGATKLSHKVERERCKAIVLGVNYGMGPKSLALSAGITEVEARELLERYQQTYRTFWRWSQGRVDSAMLHGHLDTVYGWRIRVGPDPNPRSLMNFPMQANGAEMLRLACIAGTEAGIEICAPIHDAVLIHAPLERLKEDVARMQGFMVDSSRALLQDFELRTDAVLVRWPDRYIDARGSVMWNTVTRLLHDLEQEAA
jgi:hypothetical protein